MSDDKKRRSWLEILSPEEAERIQKHGHKEFEQNLAAMSDDELYDAWQKAIDLRKREEFKEAWPSLDILIELLSRFIAFREYISIERQP